MWRLSMIGTALAVLVLGAWWQRAGALCQDALERRRGFERDFHVAADDLMPADIKRDIARYCVLPGR